MVKAMLVDSGSDVIAIYSAYIKSDFGRAVKVVATLNEASADKFWTLIETKKPDVIVIDIRFFGLGTLRTIGEVVAKFPDIRLLISGTYDDYDYLRASMEYGATDYIYKPAKKREFELALRHIVGLFEALAKQKEQDGQMIAQYERDISFFRERFLTNLLSGILDDKAEIDRSMAYFGLNLNLPYAVMEMRIDHFKDAIKGLDTRSKHLLVYRIFWNCNNHLIENEIGYAFKSSFNSVTCIIGGVMGVAGLLEVATTLKDLVAKQTGLEVTIGMGNAYMDFSGLSISAKEADAALRYRYLMGYNSIIPIEFVEPSNHITYRYPKHKERQLVYAAVAGEYTYAVKLLGEILDALDKAGKLPERLIPRIVMNIVISISRYASELGMDAEARFRDFFDFGKALGLQTTSQARDFMEEALKNFCGFVTQGIDEKAGKMASMAKLRADENFFEDLSLDGLALEYGTTSDFLGKAFLQRVGTSFREYLQAKRIARAKEILSTEEASEEEVAARVGFFDVRVFRSVFRRREGVFPLEYRR